MLPSEQPEKYEAWHAAMPSLARAWTAARLRDPCDRCGKVDPRWHHATCEDQARNLCHDCYLALGAPVTQLYPGDYGLPAFGGGAHVS